MQAALVFASHSHSKEDRRGIYGKVGIQLVGRAQPGAGILGEEMTHDLKIWPTYFERVLDGSKTFEVRVNDRGYQQGDEINLREWDPEVIEEVEHLTPVSVDFVERPRGYTGRNLFFKCGYVLPLSDGRVVFSLLPINKDC